MSIENVSYNGCGFSLNLPNYDEEEKRIMRRLRAYGIKPTGSKSADKARLHEIELKEAQTLNYISNKFLTVTKLEQARIQEKKKANRTENNPELNIKKQTKKTDTQNQKLNELNKSKKNATPEEKIGATALGEQLWITIKMKKKR